jgi:hypothetical protein
MALGTPAAAASDTRIRGVLTASRLSFWMGVVACIAMVSFFMTLIFDVLDNATFLFYAASERFFSRPKQNSFGSFPWRLRFPPLRRQKEIGVILQAGD